MALRVLPSLSLAVTEHAVRARKRIVMLVPGLVAFGVYRLAKHFLPLTEPVVLLIISGMVGMVTALSAYRIGRDAAWRTVREQDGSRLLAWMSGWIGFVYAIQLSLLVLALLWLVGYDYLQHPDGPAMMAIMISCTAVARDAFEIGHVRKLNLMGKPCPTFPHGAPLRDFLFSHRLELVPWVAAGLALGAVGASLGQWSNSIRTAVIVQASAVTMLGSVIALCAYLRGTMPHTSWSAGLFRARPAELVKYWWWPGLAFASTYYLAAGGVAIFLLKQSGIPTQFAVLSGSAVVGMMALYGFYLGHRRQVEERQGNGLTSEMLRCPFVMGILGRASKEREAMAAAPASKV